MAARRPTITLAPGAATSATVATGSSSGGGGGSGLGGHWRGESAFAPGAAGGFFPLIKDAAALHNEKEVSNEGGTGAQRQAAEQQHPSSHSGPVSVDCSDFLRIDR